MKAILASLTGLPGDHAALKTAALVARAHDAHIDALHVYMGIDAIQALIGVDPSTSRDRMAAISSQLAQEESERRANARVAFDEICLRQDLPTAAAPHPHGSGPTAALVDVDSLALSETARRARYYDLVVMARERALLPSRIPTVLLEAGRPVLVAPPSPRDSVGTNIAIAWKPCAEAARALTAAAPFLARTSKVTLLVTPERGAAQADAIRTAKPLQETLVWRGLQAQIVATEPSDDAGAALREAAYAQEADLLVLGGYGHGRLREWVLGGVTRTLLHDCATPLLMAH